MEYKAGELERLHRHLYAILGRIDEVCSELDIRYFIIAGSAIGAHFEGAILPWDDDVDIGMEREEYERFIREAQPLLGDKYFVQNYLTERDTPYYFTKVRMAESRFEGDDEVGLDINHGIFIDIFPMDRTPDCTILERGQRALVSHLANAFVATTIPLREGGAVARWVVKNFARIVGKSQIFDMLCWAQRLFENSATKRINIVRMPKDHISRESVNPPQRIRFGDLELSAPRDLESYLRWHYPNLRRHIPREEQINHAPRVLEFCNEIE